MVSTRHQADGLYARFQEKGRGRSGRPLCSFHVWIFDCCKYVAFSLVKI
ncbi:hypothetical protein WCP94_000681 (plasmid) [Bilophila wadsworthia]